MLFDNCPRIIERHYGKIAVLLLFLFLLLAFFYMFLGPVNEDEGWYLYASKLVYQGKILYSDFSYTQTPLLPYVYGIPQLLFGTGLCLGRITSLLFGIMTLVLCMVISNRLAGKLATVICGAAISLNLFAIYFLTITKTYSLTAFFLSVSILFLVSKINKWVKYSFSTIFLCLAAGTRLSAILAIPILLIYLLIFERENKRYFLLATITSLVTIAAIFLPFILRDPELFWYNVVGFHMARYNASDLLHLIQYKINTLSSIARVFSFMMVSVVSGAVLFFVYNWRRMKKALLNHGIYVYLIGILLIIFFSNCLPGGSYAEYQVANLPLMAILAGCIYSKYYEKSVTPEGKSVVLAIICVLLLLNLIGHGTHHVDISGRKLPLDEISRIADYIKEHIPKDEPIFTYHTYLAIQSQRNVLPGLEMAIFSYYPEWDTQTAQRYHVTNNEIVKGLITSQKAAAVILTDLDFKRSASYAPLDKEEQEHIRNDILTKIEEYYYLAKEMDSFGQWRDIVYVYLRKDRY
ncbi:MAG: hypothetical protein AMJ92_12265 [candidate division Zixibacteria bacterium SM23_81]|nr:MAG: hypothetical protein AMJ92_12265 [candidate division Zixibacteria bacterium SM23_81]